MFLTVFLITIFYIVFTLYTAGLLLFPLLVIIIYITSFFILIVFSNIKYSSNFTKFSFSYFKMLIVLTLLIYFYSCNSPQKAVVMHIVYPTLLLKKLYNKLLFFQTELTTLLAIKIYFWYVVLFLLLFISLFLILSFLFNKKF